MRNYDLSAEFSDLVARHRDIIIAMVKTNQFSPVTTSNDTSVGTITEELILRAQIVAWRPTNRGEAYRKLEHLVQALAAGVPIDKMSVDIAVKSVESFIAER